MSTLHHVTIKRWLANLITIEATLKAAEALPGLDMTLFIALNTARWDARCMHDYLLSLAVVDVAIQEPVV